MKNVTLLLTVFVLLSGVGLAQLQATGEDNTPAVGSTAPDFGLEELRGQSKILLAFFPAAFTPG
jgi:hypothetical protein